MARLRLILDVAETPDGTYEATLTVSDQGLSYTHTDVTLSATDHNKVLQEAVARTKTVVELLAPAIGRMQPVPISNGPIKMPPADLTVTPQEG